MNILTCVPVVGQGQGAAPRVSVSLWLNGGQRRIILDRICLDIEGRLSLPTAVWVSLRPVRLPFGAWKKRKGLWIRGAEIPPPLTKCFLPLFWKCLFFQLGISEGPFWST